VRKIPENCSVVKFHKSHQNKTTTAMKKFLSVLGRMLPPEIIGYIDEQDGVRVQQNRGEGRYRSTNAEILAALARS